MNKLRPLIPFGLTILLFIILLIGGWIFLTLPSQAEEVFGPAKKDTPYTDRLMYAVRLFLVEDDLVKPASRNVKIIDFNIGEGETPDSICTRLEDKGLISNCDAFKLFLIYSGYDRSIQAGKYKLSSGATAIEIAQAIQDYSPEDVDFNILAGWRLEEIAAVLPTSGLNITSEEFLKKTKSVEGVSMPPEYGDFKSFEGVLLPGSYTIKRDADVYAFLTVLMSAFDQKVDQEIRAGFKQQGVTLYQGVTLASVVEREAMVDSEKPQIASVFLNRIANGIKLESDPTVQYAIGYVELTKSWWKTPLTADDLAVDSLYNTYLYSGLPPAPICNPGIKALRAVAFPVKTSYYFFRAKCDGSGEHDFSETYDEHVSKACP
jgi:UPF0755 protein